MALSTGTKLGPYEVLGAAGAGGMGEVYRARDTRLERTVAIKVLPEHLTSSADSKQRFEREAKAISSLQHPHICTLYDVGSQDGVDFLVMEYLEGETLAERLRKGPLPLDQLLKIGTQIADALEKAHRAAIVHRDLKPGNIMLTSSGAKLLDFGLAKPAAMGTMAGSGSAPLLSAAMTLTSPSPHASPLTSAGMLVGTVQYMSPEQIEGKEADARSDIFAFGAVLYEMATGQRAFQGKSQLSVATAILEKDPDPICTTQPSSPPMLDQVVRTCVAKDPAERFQSAHDVGWQLRWIAANPEKKELPSPAKPSGIAWTVAGVALLLLIIGAAYTFLRGGPSGTTIRAEISAPEKIAFDPVGDRGGMPVLSPQGDQIVFAAHGPNSTQALWVRSLDNPVPRKLEGTEGAAHPFWSPDGQFIGFYANLKLNKIPVTGGPVTVLADAPNGRGASWGSDGTIVFSADFNSFLMRTSADGGAATPATKLDGSKHTTHRWPWFLPDGKHFLYLAANHNAEKRSETGIYWASLDGKENHMVVATDAGAQYASGYLLFHSQTALMAQPFDPSSGKLSGAARPLISNVRYDAGVWRSIFSVSDSGTMIYQAGTGAVRGTTLNWFDRTGKPQGQVGGILDYADVRFSPDHRRIVFMSGDPAWDVWTMDVERGTKSRITFDKGPPNQPSWSPDGRSILFTYTLPQGGGNLEIRSKPANGTGEEKTLVSLPHRYLYPEWSPDGKYLAYVWGLGDRQRGLWIVPQTGDSKPVAIVQPPSAQANVQGFRISPDGRWVAYQSDESGRFEVYITSFPTGDGKWQVSTNGASFPVWRGDGKELFFKDFNDNFFASSITVRGSEVEADTPKQLFHASVTGVGLPYDVSADGQRFLLNVAGDETPVPLNLVVNWTAELKKK
jgi:serine/threonine protein kinase/Tol biopolymer transport system component